MSFSFFTKPTIVAWMAAVAAVAAVGLSSSSSSSFAAAAAADVSTELSRPAAAASTRRVRGGGSSRGLSQGSNSRTHHDLHRLLSQDEKIRTGSLFTAMDSSSSTTT